MSDKPFALSTKSSSLISGAMLAAQAFAQLQGEIPASGISPAARRSWAKNLTKRYSAKSPKKQT